MAEADQRSRDRLPCANHLCSDIACDACGNCSLVAYCSQRCQRQHWKKHSSACKNKLAKVDWRPRWDRRGREPNFVENYGQWVQPFKGSDTLKYLWGDMPACDFLNLENNEGRRYGSDVNVCFAATGDLRSVVRTVDEVPREFRKSLMIFMNDNDIDIVIRNFFLLLLLGLDDAEISVDVAIHVWYSASLTQEHTQILDTYIRPLINDVVRNISDEDDSILLSEIFALGNGSVEIILSNGQWRYMQSIFNKNHICKKTEGSRRSIVFSRKDQVDRNLFSRTRDLHKRVAIVQFKERGVLLPFGCDSTDFCNPNPTLFDANGLWMQVDSADPLEGWTSRMIRACVTRPVDNLRNDIYGDLYFFLKSLLRRVYAKLRRKSINFGLLATSVQELPGLIPQRCMDRVDLSNTIDEGQLGLAETLRLGSALLNDKNPEATMISLFKDAAEIIARRNPMVLVERNLKLSAEFLACSASPSSPYDPVFLRLAETKDFFGRFDQWMHKYMDLTGFVNVVADSGLCEKYDNTVVAKWPYRMQTKDPREDGALDEFQTLHESGVKGSEKYVEWQLKEWGLQPKWSRA